MSQIDVERTLRALDGNNELLRDLASMFVEDAPKLFEQLRSALSERQPMKARSAVHSLKGLAATFFAKTSVDLAQRLEDAAACGDLELFACGELDRLEVHIAELTAECAALACVDRP